MDRVYDSGGISVTPPAYPTAPVLGYPVIGAAGLSTKPGAWWFHMITEELRAIITAAGNIPDPADTTQVATAINALITSAQNTLQNNINAKANIADPTFTGVVRFPTNTAGATDDRGVNAAFLNAWTGNQNINYRFGGLGVGVAAVTNEIRCAGDIQGLMSSDMRLKTGIMSFDDPVGMLSKISAFTHSWTAAELERRGGVDGTFVRERELGVSAQDVRDVFPEAVGERADGMLAVNYEKLVVPLIAAVQQLAAEVRELKAKLGE